MQIHKASFQVLLVLLPCGAIDPRCRIPLEPEECCPQQINTHRVKQSGVLDQAHQYISVETPALSGQLLNRNGLLLFLPKLMSNLCS